MSDKRWKETWVPSPITGIPITVTQPEDPAFALLQDDYTSKRHVPIRRFCYICEDPEFEQMGLPLCQPCPWCCREKGVDDAGHVAADDTVCDDCDNDVRYWDDPSRT